MKDLVSFIVRTNVQYVGMDVDGINASIDFHAIDPDEWEEHIGSYTEFVQAIRSGDLPIVQRLLKSGPGTLPGLNPPVIEAIRAGGEQIILALLRAEPEAAVKARDVECGATALHWAAVGGDIEIVHTLIQHGADVNALSCEGFTPVHAAAACGHAKVLSLLLKNAGSVSAVTATKVNPLHLAAEMGHETTAVLLIFHGAEIDLRVRDRGTGRTCLHWAAHHGLHQAVGRILEEFDPAGIDSPDNLGDTPLHLAACRGHCEIALALLRRGAELDPVNFGGVTPLLSAVFFGQVAVVEVLLNQKANMRVVDSLHARTALHWAAQNDDTAVLLLLVKFDLDFEALDGGGLSALNLATESGASQAVEILRAKSAE